MNLIHHRLHGFSQINTGFSQINTGSSQINTESLIRLNLIISEI